MMDLKMIDGLIDGMSEASAKATLRAVILLIGDMTGANKKPDPNQAARDALDVANLLKQAKDEATREMMEQLKASGVLGRKKKTETKQE